MPDPVPEETPDRSSTRGGTFAAGGAPSQILAHEEFAISNPTTSAGDHTFTFTPRGSGNNTKTFTEDIQAGQSCKYSGRGIQAVSIDSSDSAVTWKAGPRGTIYAISGPKSAGGAGTAQSVTYHVATSILPGANATFQMAGLGSHLAITPLKSGKVRVSATVSLIAGASTNAPVVKWAFGTGAAPVAQAAATGTVPETVSGAVEGTVAGLSALNAAFTVSIVISGLTLGTAYWFDLQVFVKSTANDNASFYGGSVEELPA